VSDQNFLGMVLTNALSPVRVIEVFHDLVAENRVIAAMSSEIGNISNVGFWELYSSSETALNMLMKAFSERHPDDPRALLLVAPGWVRTEMGDEEATLETSDSIPLIIGSDQTDNALAHRASVEPPSSRSFRNLR
jgi:NAD(P)-dependent dehydrogenase (short-subunit alcohol dehydrogenase family)